MLALLLFMMPLAVLPIWADIADYRACRILMYPDRWAIELSIPGQGVARTEVWSAEAAFDLANECRPTYLHATPPES